MFGSVATSPGTHWDHPLGRCSPGTGVGKTKIARMGGITMAKVAMIIPGTSHREPGRDPARVLVNGHWDHQHDQLIVSSDPNQLLLNLNVDWAHCTSQMRKKNEKKNSESSKLARC